MAKAAKASKTTTKATKAAKKSAAAGKGKGKGKENTTSKTQNARNNVGKGGTKKKSGGESAGGEGGKKKSGGITKAVSKKIDAWWEQHSDDLVKKVVENHDWKECDAKNTVQAYRQFLIVKREMKDWENELIPCEKVIYMVDVHQDSHLDYLSDIEVLCGHDFKGRELMVFGKDDYFDRERATFDAVKKRFGSEFNETLWNTVLVGINEIGSESKFDPASDDYGCVRHQRSDPLESAFEEFARLDPVEPRGWRGHP